MTIVERSFNGYPRNTEATPVPSLFFTAVLSQIEDINELKITLYIFWLIKHKRGYLRFVTVPELLHDPLLPVHTPDDKIENKESILKKVLDMAVNRKSLLKVTVKMSGNNEEAYFINMEPDRTTVKKILSGDLVVPDLEMRISSTVSAVPSQNIFSLYEQNVGIITPIIAEELKKAEESYPEDWIKDAIVEAVDRGKRNWKYISRILERWQEEGKDNGKIGGYSKKEKDTGKYIKGKYGHLVNR